MKKNSPTKHKPNSWKQTVGPNMNHDTFKRNLQKCQNGPAILGGNIWLHKGTCTLPKSARVLQIFVIPAKHAIRRVRNNGGMVQNFKSVTPSIMPFSNKGLGGSKILQQACCRLILG